MMYMQSLRFLTDYLNDDKYYGSRYEGHNYTRALNQATLLKRFRELSPRLHEIAPKSPAGSIKPGQGLSNTPVSFPFFSIPK
jgi:hypothetical protein